MKSLLLILAGYYGIHGSSRLFFASVFSMVPQKLFNSSVGDLYFVVMMLVLYVLIDPQVNLFLF